MVEIVLATDGTQILKICNRCLAAGAEDENCEIERDAVAFAQALQVDGHVVAVSDPGDDVPGFTAKDACEHNAMVATGDITYAWKCADCGYIYGRD